MFAEYRGIPRNSGKLLKWYILIQEGQLEQDSQKRTP
jgi:hypothetical protein